MIPSFSPLTSEISQKRSFLNPPCLLGIFSLSLLLGALLFPTLAAEDGSLHFATLSTTTSTTSAATSADSSGSTTDLTANGADIIVGERLAKRTVLSDGELARIDVYFENADRDPSLSITALGHYAVGGPVRTVEGTIKEVFEKKLTIETIDGLKEEIIDEDIDGVRIENVETDGSWTMPCVDDECRGTESDDDDADSVIERRIDDRVSGDEVDDDSVKSDVVAEVRGNDFLDDDLIATDSSENDQDCKRLSWTQLFKRKNSRTNGKKETWIAWFRLSKDYLSKSRGTSFFDGVHRAMFLGASAVMVFASFRHPQLLRQLDAAPSTTLFKKPVVFLRAAEFNVSLLFHALASKLKATVKISPSRDEDLKGEGDDSTPASVLAVDSPASLTSEKSKEQTTSTVVAGGELTFWGRCGRYSQWHGVVCLEEQLETTSTSSSSASASPECESPSKSTSDAKTNSQAVFHVWNLLYSASISLCLFLLLKVIGGSTTMSLTMTRRGDEEDDFLFPPSDKDVEISLRRLARDALKAMPIRRYQISPKRCPESEPQMCPICLSNFTWNQKIRLLPCLHEFHPRCADPWLVDHRTCPLCKLNIVRHWALTQI